MEMIAFLIGGTGRGLTPIRGGTCGRPAPDSREPLLVVHSCLSADFKIRGNF